MSHSTNKRPASHPAAEMYAQEYRDGKLSRREFLTRSTALGVSAAAAYSLIGLPQPAAAQTEIAEGGVLRIQQLVKAMKDPMTYDWSELGNQSRGFLEYLAEYRADGSFVPMLLEGWEANEDASQYTLRVRQGVTWNNGDAFTAEDVARNFERWCDGSVEGNAMASRFNGLRDAETEQLREGAIEIVDSHTLRLNYSEPDITLIAQVSDYPAAVVHSSFTGGNPYDNGIGTGPYRPVSIEPGLRAVLERVPDFEWWGTAVYGGPYVDRIEYIDYGVDPISWLSAAEAGEVNLLYESVGEYIDLLDSIGWTRSETTTAATVVIRPNHAYEVDGRRPYADERVRRALTMAVDNAVLLELGYAGLGSVAENHHACPIHPEYADIGAPAHDPAAAAELMAEAGFGDFEHELISPDEEWLSNTGNAVAAQLRDAGIPVRRTITPGATFWQAWATHGFSTTSWNGRPLAVQNMALAYTSTGSWNETAFASEEFDAAMAEALALADADARREVMVTLEGILQSQGIIIQPYWRSLFNHQDGSLVNAEKHPAHEIHVHRIGFAA
ncbi:ABC transporter substrate-binding protein [Roseibacterium sp. SDUM158017]|uniref:ABC transporter substrate-binding protein n=1 Tax=Roseicyclus salinarum TaxID=3036773 RepID=UPI0024151EB4|nr:ABC transporter substrate-binding protein [Roseibacterium sp. SDUM158017]MDG4648388.1 ABC transporter substrate-binding protein [Roseibacterium sp. SDUM158017]